MKNSSSATSPGLNPSLPASAFAILPAHLERKIAVRWKEWEPWVRIHQLRVPNFNPAVAAAETTRLRQRHREQILRFTQAGIAMRLVRGHRLDDPRITDDVRALIVGAVIERRKKARPKPRIVCETASVYRPGSVPRLGQQRGSYGIGSENPRRDKAHPKDLGQVIRGIQERVSQHFYLREMPDPNLRVRCRRWVFLLPRQIAMYIARQLTGASLQEIGRQFGGMHHTTVLHSINKIETLRLLDQDLDRSITRQVIEHGAVCQGPPGPGREAAKFDGAHLAYSPATHGAAQTSASRIKRYRA